ncbi:MAG: phosphoenolpyruvate carboxylase, partial [Planctomycetales bacterium]|nr:phosphoenolpyruvate carboxylase [Planctomycetales bacterium]
PACRRDDMSADRPSDRQNELRREIDQLGRLFGDIIKRFSGEAGFELVEQIRALARQLRHGDESAGPLLHERTAALSDSQLRTVVRSFSIVLEIANLAEDRQRVRVLRQRERDSYPAPRRESVGAALAEFHRRGLSTEEVQQLVDRVAIELVLTAHPTEAKRRSVRRILRKVRQVLAQGDRPDVLPREQEKITDQIRGELYKLWQTDFVRPWRPTVLQEVERGLSIMPVLWSEVPALLADLRTGLQETYPKVKMPAVPLVRYGSWIGGDRDGNPFVTAEVTAETLTLLRRHAVTAHRTAARRLGRSLSISDRLAAAPSKLEAALAAASERWPDLAEQLQRMPPLETYRRWLHVITWRLRRTLDSPVDATAKHRDGGYSNGDELAADVKLVAESLCSAGDELVARNEVQPWLDQIHIFGLHSARLDIRQHSGVYSEAINELWQAAGLCADPASLDEEAREQLLLATMADERLPGVDFAGSELTVESLQLFALLRRIARHGGMAPLGAHVLSMTKRPSDILAMLWLWRWSERVDGGHPRDGELRLPLSPLFETIDDLHAAADTLRMAFSIAQYRDYLAAQGNDQMVMVGYSDSTKDGGYLAAQWALQQSQIEMQRVADEFGVRLTFFHGRGGSLGRGGGPAARGILSLPAEAFSGSLRLTEQGEVLAERYDTPQIAYRHLEQVSWAALMSASRQPSPPPEPWSELMADLAERSLTAYRKLVDAPGFTDFYRAVTPIDEIERLPIGSRPSKRKASNRIEDLRAIPWVFSWTQCRALLPAWYGLGSAVEARLGDEGVRDMLQTMYREWPFFTAAISNADLALAKANMPVFKLYAKQGKNVPGADELTAAIIDEFDRSKRAVLAITGGEQLLDDVPWLQRSIQVRNGYVDPLNVVQAVLLERLAAEPDAHADAIPDELEHLVNLTIKGVSAGMRTTG